MKKISVETSNNFCPQTLFLYGTYKDDGNPNFGLFCWFSYIWIDNSLGVMACIGGDKLTKDRILETGCFSANLVTEDLLPLADYYGNVYGRDNDKSQIDTPIESGLKLNVPILSESPVTFELKVRHQMSLEGSDVFLCEIVNTLMEECTVHADSPEAKYDLLKKYAPVCSTNNSYCSFDGRFLGAWGKPMQSL